MKQLHCETRGAGPDLVLLHGWGMGAQVWAPVLPELTARYRVTRVDLPGHGDSPVLAGDDLSLWLEALLAVAPKGAVWIGWSLGGMLALAAAEACPDSISGVVSVASNLRFISTRDWPDAISPETFQDVVDGIAADPVKTLQRFIALQFLGVREAAAVPHHLRAQVAAARPSSAGLLAGLDMLRTIDNRSRVRNVKVPVQMLFGQKDKLVPPAVISAIQMLNPAVDIRSIAGAGHAPFLTHTEVFLNTVKPFFAAHAG